MTEDMCKCGHHRAEHFKDEIKLFDGDWGWDWFECDIEGCECEKYIEADILGDKMIPEKEIEKAIETLIENGFLVKDEKGDIGLTEKGLKAGLKIAEELDERD